MTFSLKFSDQITPALIGLVGRLRDTTPLLRQIAGDMLDDAETNFETESDPSGVAWKPLSPAYKARRYAAGFTGPILQRKGRGAASVSRSVRHGKTFAIVGTNVRYMRYHQGTRPFLGFGRRLRDQINRRTARFILRT